MCKLSFQFTMVRFHLQYDFFFGEGKGEKKGDPTFPDDHKWCLILMMQQTSIQIVTRDFYVMKS